MENTKFTRKLIRNLVDTEPKSSQNESKTVKNKKKNYILKTDSKYSSTQSVLPNQREESNIGVTGLTYKLNSREEN